MFIILNYIITMKVSLYVDGKNVPLDRWKKKYPEFCSAYRRGRAAGQAVFMRKVNAAAWNSDLHHVNNGLITLMAVNKYKMLTRKSEGKKKVDMSLADAVRRRHEIMASGASL